MIKFNRPVVFFDLETTGTNVRLDRIVEICMVKRDYFGEKSDVKTRRLNPGIPIPPMASEVHGITDEMVKDQPTFAQVAKGIFEFIDGCDIAGYNSINFDIPLLWNEFQRAGIDWMYQGQNFYDMCNIFKVKEGRTLSDAVKFYLDRDHEGAHGAEADVLATMLVFEAQIERYNLEDLLPGQLALLSNYDKPMLDVSGKFTTDQEGEVIFNFGQHKGERAKSKPDYLDWMIRKGDFSKDTIKIAKQLI